MASDDYASTFLDIYSSQHACKLWHLSHSLVYSVRTSDLYLPNRRLTICRSFPIHNMTPIWIFPAYPLLLSAPFASNLIDALPGPAEAFRINAIAVSLGAIMLQGTGFLVSLNIYGAFIYRLMTQKLPHDTLKPGMVSLVSSFLSATA